MRRTAPSPLRGTLLFLALLCFSALHSQQDSYNRDSLPEHQKLYLKGVTLADSAHYDEAIQVFKKVVKMKKDHWEAMFQSGKAKIRLKDYKGAIKDFDLSEKFAPAGYEIFKYKGIAYFLSQQYPQSKAMLDTAVAISKDEKIDDAELFYYHARLMFAGKSYKPALSACETALEYNPRYAEVMFLKGEIRFAMKEYNYAIRELGLAIPAMGDKPDYRAYKIRAKARFEVQDYKGAVKDWNVYIENMPKEEEALVARAAAKINSNDNSSAIADLDEAIKMNPKNAVSWCYRGVAKGGNRNYEEALKDLDHAIQLKFDYSTAFVNRAAIKMAKRDKHGACEDLEKADGLGNELAVKLIEQYCKH